MLNGSDFIANTKITRKHPLAKAGDRCTNLTMTIVEHFLSSGAVRLADGVQQGEVPADFVAEKNLYGWEILAAIGDPCTRVDPAQLEILLEQGDISPIERTFTYPEPVVTSQTEEE